MFRPAQSLPTWRRRLSPPASLAGLLLMGCLEAQAAITTTAELRQACETSPGHVVVLDDSTKILDGARPPGSEMVSTPCTLILGANFEAERVSLTFAGPLVLQSANKAEVKLTMSYLSASSIAVNLPAASSMLQTNLSGLQARTGSILVTLGAESGLLVLERLLPGPENALEAAATVEIQAGRKFTGLLAEGGIRGPLGVRVAMTGGEGLLKVEEVLIEAPLGGVVITGTGTKSQVSLDKVNARFADGLTVRLTGEEAAISLKQIGAGGEGGAVATGGVVFEAGTGTAGNGKIEASEISVFDVASITLRASMAGIKGGIKVEKSVLAAVGDVRIESGREGKTEVKENRGGSETRVRVASGIGGGCVSEQNEFVAAVLELCP